MSYRRGGKYEMHSRPLRLLMLLGYDADDNYVDEDVDNTRQSSCRAQAGRQAVMVKIEALLQFRTVLLNYRSETIAS